MTALLSISNVRLSFAIVEGGEISGGLDQLELTSGTAWFVGRDRIIKYCLERSDNFGVEDNTLQKTIESGFSHWSAYMEAKRINQGIATQIKRVECSGAEDLKFYFGTEDDRVRIAQTSYNNPIAISKLTSYNRKTGFGQGFVWVANPEQIGMRDFIWTHNDALHGALMHEIGHVFGCAHIENTIMSTDLAKWVVRTGTAGTVTVNDTGIDFMHEIDHERELRPCAECSVVYDSIPPEAANYQDYLIVAFQTLTGTSPVGDISARFSKHFLADEKRIEGELLISDAKRSYSFKLTGGVRIADVSDNAPLFKVSGFENSDTGWMVTYSESYLAMLQTVSSEIAVVVNFNMGNIAFQIHPLFEQGDHTQGERPNKRVRSLFMAYPGKNNAQ